MDRDFSNGFVHELLTLLDMIEMKGEADLSRQRFAIAEKHGMRVVFKGSTSRATH